MFYSVMRLRFAVGHYKHVGSIVHDRTNKQNKTII